MSYKSSFRNTLFPDHVYHAFHHMFTTKKPPQNAILS